MHKDINNGFTLSIQEYGKEVRKYSDTDKARFLKQAKEVIINHLETCVNQGRDEVKNTAFHIFTY